MKPQTWRRVRQIMQILTFLFFLFLFTRTTLINPGSNMANPFYRLNPLVAITTMLASRTFIAVFGLALLTVIITLIFGRVWCGWFCPLGTVLEWLTPKKAKRHRQRSAPSEKWRAVKYIILIIILFAALLGNQSLLFLDPITIMTRTLATSVWPSVRVAIYGIERFLYQFPILWGALDWVHDAILYPTFKEGAAVFTLAVPMFLFFAAIVALNWWVERFWCRYLCPLGALLGLLSKFSLLRREVGTTCSACALCNGECPTGTIDPQDDYHSDPAECIVCYDCIVDCTRGSAKFRWHLPQLGGDKAPHGGTNPWSIADRHDYDPQRRAVLAGAATAVVGVALAGVEPITQRQPAYMIRPPGVTPAEFETLCIRCGECIRICPTHGLQPSLFEGGVQNLLTPRLVPRLGHCDYDCNACGTICPTGAIPPLPLAVKQHTPIGLARIDQSRCLPWAHNIPCAVCEEVCPVDHKAIWLHTVEVLDVHANPIIIQRPYIVKELCIGCGICENQCPMGGEGAIRVFALTETGGYVGGDEDYRPRHGRRGE